MILAKLTSGHLIKGKSAEDRALAFLLAKGLTLVERNFRCRYGELDLVMQDRLSLVIIEVRYRQSESYGSAAETVTVQKQNRIIAATQYYLSKLRRDCPLRFDVIAMNGKGDIDWIQNAF